MNDLFSKENKYRKNQYSNDIVDEFGERQITMGVLERVSTDMQANEGDSLEMQRELAQDHAKEIKGVIFKFYTEEGISASKTRIEKRHKLQELIQDVRDGKINYIVAYKRDRIFRNAQEYMWFIQFLVDNNCEIYLTARDEQQIDLSAFKVAGAAKMMEVMMAMISEMESSTTSARVSDTMISLAKKGEYTGGSTPIGYQRIDDKFVPMDGVKELFAKIEDVYLRGFGLFSIAKWLNGGHVNGLVTLEKPVPKPIENKTSDIWNHRNIDTILFNPIYTGHFSYQSKKNVELDRLIRKSELIVPIRSEDRQRELNTLHHKKTSESRPPRAYNTPFLLSGILYCSECGEKMITSTSQPKNSDKKHSYYRCKNKTKSYKNIKCENKGYRKEILEALVLKVARERIKEFLKPEINNPIYAKIELDKATYVNQIDEIKNKIKEYERKLNRYTELVEELEEDIELQKVYMKKQKDILIELNDLRQTYSFLENKMSNEDPENNFEKLIKLAKNFGDMVENAPVGIQKQMLETLFSNIYVNKNGQVKMMISAGLPLESLMNDVESNEDSEVVIGFGTGGSAHETKDITNVIKQFILEFNYFEYVDLITKLLYENLKEYLSNFDECVIVDNAYNIDTSKIQDYKEPKFKNEDRIKKSIHYQYMISKYHLHHRALESFIVGDRLSIVTINEILKINNCTLFDYLKYLSEFFPEIVVDEDVVELSVTLSASLDLRHESLFKDKVICVCGSTCLKRRNVLKTSYECHNKRKKKCKAKNVKENDIIIKIEADTNSFINSKCDVEKLVNTVQLTDLEGNFKIIYSN